MRNSKKLKLILLILICILIIFVGFIGIYSKKVNSYKNVLPKYEFATDLRGSTVLEFEVDHGTQTVYYDKDGKKVDTSIVTEENESDYKKEEKLINENESLNEKNYKKVVDIMKQRLAFLKADQYKIDLDNKTGKIVLAFEDAYPDDIKSILPMEGKFELIDSNTKDVILDYNDFKSAEPTYAALDNGNYVTYINLKLNDSGLEKIKNIDKYKATTDEENKEENVNKFQVMFDNDKITEVSYDDILLNSKTLRIATAQNLSSNSAINSELNANTLVSKLATMGKLPVVYKLTAEEYVQSSANNYLQYIIISLATICTIISIYFIVKYKTKGILTVIGFVANISLFLIMIRLTKIQISLNGFAGIIGLILLNTILLNNILKSLKETDKTFSENIKNAFLNSIDSFVVILIVFAVFAFSSMTVINSMGLLVFWGWLTIIIGTLILTVPMLAVANKKM